MDITVQAVLIEGDSLSATIGDSNSLSATISEVVTTPPYEGAYIAIPSTVGQSFPTEGKRMIDDFEVTAIPYSETTNPAGGKTATIAN